MSEIRIEKPTEEELKSLNIDKWSPWECEPGTFEWQYDSNETAYVMEGKVKISTSSGEVEINKGDLVTFPKGLKCTWNVIQKIRKVYTFE